MKGISKNTLGKVAFSSLVSFQFYDGCEIHFTTRAGNVGGWAYRIIGQIDLRCPHGCSVRRFLNEGDLPVLTKAE